MESPVRVVSLHFVRSRSTYLEGWGGMLLSQQHKVISFHQIFICPKSAHERKENLVDSSSNSSDPPDSSSNSSDPLRTAVRRLRTKCKDITLKVTPTEYDRLRTGGDAQL